MTVKFFKKNKDAKVPFKKHESDFCYDVYAVSEEEVAPNVWRYGLGFGLQIERDKDACDIPIGYSESVCSSSVVFLNNEAKLSIDFRPRSSVWETGMSLANCEPTIDEDYTGEIKLCFYHVMPNMPRYKVGDRIAQMKIGVTFPITFVETEKLDDTVRGENGFGSTGRR